MSTSMQASVAGGSQADMKEKEKGGSEDAPENAVSAYKKKEPPPESPESIKLRRLVILSFWAIIIAIGVPIWWRTTTIYRASLPLDQMMDWADGRVRTSDLSRNSRLTMSRLAGQYSHSVYPLRQVRYKITKPIIFCGRLNMRWTISMISLPTIFASSCHQLPMPQWLQLESQRERQKKR